MTTTAQHDTKATATALRKALRDAFPGAKFSVRMARGTAYGWLDVNWTNGPTPDAVEAITSQFPGDEYYCRGIISQRTVTPDVIARGVAAIGTSFGARHIIAEGGEAFELYSHEDDAQIARRWAQTVDLT